MRISNYIKPVPKCVFILRGILWTASSPVCPIGYMNCVFIEVHFENWKMLEAIIFLQKFNHTVITHANTSNDIKNPNFFRNSWGMMSYLSNAPLNKESIKLFIRKHNSYYAVMNVSSKIHEPLPNHQLGLLLVLDFVICP